MQNSQIPAKWYKPFAADDAAKVEIPITTPDPTRASQSLGFPPLTMQPPESGGVPPQGEDFNGAMNQVARIAWWKMAGGALPFDSVWATNAAIGGYPEGAVVTSADLRGEWISTADNNTNNPDTNGTGWVPGYAYGSAFISGLTNVNVTLTPAQAAKDIIQLSGALTGNIQIILPVWVKSWIVINNCTGAFSVTCKTAAGAGAVVSQGGGAQIVWGDGTNIIAMGGNSASPLLVGPATLAAHAMQLGQAVGRLVGVQVLTSSGTYTRTAGAVSGIVRILGGGSGGSGSLATAAGEISLGTGGGGGAYGEHYFAGTLPASQAYTIGAGGFAGGVGAVGGAGGTTTFGSLSAPGAPASPAPTFGPPPVFVASASGAAVATGCNMINSAGSGGTNALGITTGSFIGGGGGDTPLGGGAPPRVTTSSAGANAATRGAGGGGGVNGTSTPGQLGGAGGPGVIIVYEFS